MCLTPAIPQGILTSRNCDQQNFSSHLQRRLLRPSEGKGLVQGHISLGQGQVHLGSKTAPSFHFGRKEEGGQQAGRLTEEILQEQSQDTDQLKRSCRRWAGREGLPLGSFLLYLGTVRSQDPGSRTLQRTRRLRPKFHLTGGQGLGVNGHPLAPPRPPGAVQPDFLLHQAPSSQWGEGLQVTPAPSPPSRPYAHTDHPSHPGPQGLASSNTPQLCQLDLSSPLLPVPHSDVSLNTTLHTLSVPGTANWQGRGPERAGSSARVTQQGDAEPSQPGISSSHHAEPNPPSRASQPPSRAMDLTCQGDGQRAGEGQNRGSKGVERRAQSWSVSLLHPTAKASQRPFEAGPLPHPPDRGEGGRRGTVGEGAGLKGQEPRGQARRLLGVLDNQSRGQRF